MIEVGDYVRINTISDNILYEVLDIVITEMSYYSIKMSNGGVMNFRIGYIDNLNIDLIRDRKLTYLLNERHGI